MKKLFIILLILTAFFTSCGRFNDIYDLLNEQSEQQKIEQKVEQANEEEIEKIEQVSEQNNIKQVQVNVKEIHQTFNGKVQLIDKKEHDNITISFNEISTKTDKNGEFQLDFVDHNDGLQYTLTISNPLSLL